MPVYLFFYHGRHTSKEELDDWGVNGPILGPFTAIQITYGCHIKALSNSPINHDPIGIGKDGLVEIYGAFYGDFQIIDTKTFRIGFKKRWEETKRILSIPNKNLPLLINETEEWIKTYVERSLKHDPHTEKPSAPRRCSKWRPSRSRRKNP
jgi:hypothetical protein